jgi:hypothetical protein
LSKYLFTGYNLSKYLCTGYNLSKYLCTGYNLSKYLCTGYNLSKYLCGGIVCSRQRKWKDLQLFARKTFVYFGNIFSKKNHVSFPDVTCQWTASDSQFGLHANCIHSEMISASRHKPSWNKTLISYLKILFSLRTSCVSNRLCLCVCKYYDYRGYWAKTCTCLNSVSLTVRTEKWMCLVLHKASSTAVWKLQALIENNDSRWWILIGLENAAFVSPKTHFWCLSCSQTGCQVTWPRQTGSALTAGRTTLAGVVIWPDSQCKRFNPLHVLPDEQVNRKWTATLFEQNKFHTLDLLWRLFEYFSLY